jgi:hypothetical protein
MQGFQPLPKKKEFIGPSSCPIKASSRGRHTRHPRPHREDGGDSGADVVARVDGRRDDRAATIDVVVVVIEDVDGRDGAERGCAKTDDGGRRSISFHRNNGGLVGWGVVFPLPPTKSIAMQQRSNGSNRGTTSDIMLGS